MNTIDKSVTYPEQTLRVAQGIRVSEQADAVQQLSKAAESKASGNTLQYSGSKLQQNEQAKESTSNPNLIETTESLNQFMASTGRSLNFSVESDLNQTVIKVVNTETDEVVRQIPSEEAIALAKSLQSSLSEDMSAEQGLIIEKDA